MSTTTVIVNGLDWTAYAKRGGIRLGKTSIDVTLVDPPAMNYATLSGLRMHVTIDANSWPASPGALIGRVKEETNHDGTHKYVTLQATVFVDWGATPAPFALSDVPNGTTTFALRNLSRETTRRADGNETRVTCETLKAGLLPAMTVAVTSAQYSWVAAEFSISEVSVDWLKADTPVYSLTLGDFVVELSTWVADESAGILPITRTKITDGEIVTPKLAAGAVTTDKLEAQSVTAAKLEATLLLASLIKTGETGTRRVEIDIEGIRLVESDESLLVRVPTNGDPVYVKGQVTAASLLSETSAAFRTMASLESSAVMTVQNGISTPANVPTLTASVDSLALTSTPPDILTAAGIGYDDTASTVWIAADPTKAGAYVAHEYNATTGVLVRSFSATGTLVTTVATLGATTHIKDTAAGFTGSTSSHIAVPLTMPRAGRITKVSAYFAGRLGACSARVGLWNDVTGAGNSIAESSTFTAGSGGATTLGASSQYDKTLTTPYSAANGETVYAGFRHTNTGEGFQFDRNDGAGKTTYAGDDGTANGTGWGVLYSSSKPNVYITYEYDVDTRLETAANVGVCTDHLTYVYTLDANGVIWKYDRTNGAYIGKSAVLTAITGTKSKAGLFYDVVAAKLVVTTLTGTGAGVYPKFVQVDPTTLTAGTIYSAAAGTTFSGTTDTTRGGIRVNDPLNAAAPTYWVATTNAVYAYTFAGATATQTANRDFGQASNVGGGLTHTGGAFRGFSSATPTKIWKFSGWDWTVTSAVHWVGYAWYDYSAEKSGTAAAATDLVTLAAHGLVAGDRVRFTTLTGGTGLNKFTDYFVLAAGLTTGVFKVSLTAAGAAIDITVDYSVVVFGIIHETAVGPRASITMKRQQRLQVQTATIPTGGVEDPNRVRVYSRANAADFTAGQAFQQSEDALTSRYLNGYVSSGVTDGTLPAFPTGVPAELKSSGTGWNLKGSGIINRVGTAFPASPVANDQFWRSDLGMEFSFTGVRWLSTMLFQMSPHAGTTNIAATGEVARFAVRNTPAGTDIWLDSVSNSYNVVAGTALSASHKWVVTMLKYTGAANAAVTGTHSIASGSTSQWRGDAATGIAELLGAYYLIILTATKTGTPGNLYYYPTLNYRIVAT